MFVTYAPGIPFGKTLQGLFIWNGFEGDLDLERRVTRLFCGCVNIVSEVPLGVVAVTAVGWLDLGDDRLGSFERTQVR